MENKMKWLLVGVFGLLLPMAFLNVPLDVKQYGKSLRSTLTGAVVLETSGVADLKDSELPETEDTKTDENEEVKVAKYVASETSEAEDSETSEAEDSDTSEVEDSEMSEAEHSDTSEADDSKPFEADDTEVSQTEGSETAESEDSETAESEDSETSEAEGSETAESEDSGVSEPEDSDMLKADTKVSQTEGSEASEAEDLETAETEDTGVSEPEDSDMLKADTKVTQTEGSETSESEGSETAESEGSETAESEDSETAESEDSETVESEDTEMSESEDTETEDSGVSEPDGSEMLKADSEESRTEDSETSEAEGPETSEAEDSETSEDEGPETPEAEGSESSEAEGSELSEAEDLGLAKADNSETPDEDGSKRSQIEGSETPHKEFPFVLTENVNMSYILMDSCTEKKGKGKVYCLSEDDDPYTGFAVLTPYRSGSSMDMKAKDVIPKGCNPVTLWHLVRHGSNGPHRNDRTRFDKKLPGLRKRILKSHKDQEGNLCDKDLALIKGWKPTDMLYGDDKLSDEGKEEMTGIASRFRDVFSGLLKKDYFKIPGVKPGQGTKRSFGEGHHNQQSMIAYNKGMYAKYARFVTVRGMPTKSLQFIDYCPNYIRGVMQLKNELKPYHGFMSGSHMNLVLENVKERLGFAVSVTDVRMMYNACRYYFAWYKDKVSPWCSVFTPDDLKILEYWEDLRVYNDQGPVHEISSQQACALGKEVIDLFGNRVKNSSAEPYLTQYIVNYEALVTFITLMGIFSDQEPLDEYVISDSRVWKTTEFAGYGGNLALFLSSCSDDSFWVSALINERPIQLPPCNSALGCSWDEFAKFYKNMNKCNFQELCGWSKEYMPKTRYWHAVYKNENWA